LRLRIGSDRFTATGRSLRRRGKSAIAIESVAPASVTTRRLSREQQLLSHGEGKPMAAHKFKSGQQVTVVPHRPSGVTGGTFKIVRLLPEERGEWQYRVKCVADGHERVVLESDITH
jgi:hypothetical protein